MPEEAKTVDIDTSGPGADIEIEEAKDEAVVETEAPKEETRTYEKKKDKTLERKARNRVHKYKKKLGER